MPRMVRILLHMHQLFTSISCSWDALSSHTSRSASRGRRARCFPNFYSGEVKLFPSQSERFRSAFWPAVQWVQKGFDSRKVLCTRGICTNTLVFIWEAVDGVVVVI